MIEHHLDIATDDGAMNTFVVHPDEGSSFPVVIFYMDAPGKREELHDMARRLATVGYFVVLPNLYYRRSRDYLLKARTPEALQEMYAYMGTLDARTTEVDTAAILKFVDGQSRANGDRVGAVGYCMSGPFVVWAATRFPGRIRCIASIHGANMATAAPNSPHLEAAKLSCESYFACAENDKYAPPEDITLLEQGLRASGAPYRLEWYPGAEHGFVFPGRGATIYNKSSAERHWERLFALFARNLR